MNVEDLQNILEAITENNVVTVVAGTGTGKSTQIPSALYLATDKVFISEPTRVGTISLASYVTTQLKLGGVTKPAVGYAAEGVIKYNNSTKLVYITSGHLRNKLLQYFSDGIARALTFCSVLIVDEIHNGSLDNSVIVGLWLLARSQGVVTPRLVMTSATANTSLTAISDVVYTVAARSYPVELIYSTRDYAIDKDLALLYDTILKLILQLVQQPGTDHILVFVPGKHEVLQLIAKLNKTVTNSTIIPAYSAMATEEEQLVTRLQQNTGRRKIIIATNVAESAITIADIGYVIDSMLEKRLEASHTGGKRLVLTRITKASATQRAGRTGRTKPGKCYRMITAQTYLTLLDLKPNEVTSIPIYNTVMELLNAGLDPRTVLPDLTATKANNTIKLLQTLGMVTEGVVTAKGKFAAQFDLNVRTAGFLYDWSQTDKPLFPAIVIAAIIACSGSHAGAYLYIPANTADTKVYIETKLKGLLGETDLHTCLNIWHEFMSQAEGIDISARAAVVTNFANNRSLNLRTFRELLQMVKHCYRTLSKTKTIKVGPFTTAGAIAVAKPLLLANYKELVFTKSGKWYLPVGKTSPRYQLDNRSLGTTAPETVLGLNTQELSTGNYTRYLLAFIVDIETVTSNVKPILSRLQQLPLLENLVFDLPVVASSPTQLDKEYTRYRYVNLLDAKTLTLPFKQRIQAQNALERWLLSLANIDSQILTTAITAKQPVTVKLYQELLAHKISVPTAKALLNSWLAVVQTYLKGQTYSAGEPLTRGSTIILQDYYRHLAVNRFNLLLTYADLTAITAMCLRYSCTLPKGQHWHAPLAVYKTLVQKYGITVEGFASPINSQIIQVDPSLHYCSVFPETDKVFNSLGSFFDYDFTGQRAMINPPYIETIMSDMANKLVLTCDNTLQLKQECLFIVVGPTWTDTAYYSILQNSTYLKAKFDLVPGEHHFEDIASGEPILRLNVTTSLFIIGTDTSVDIPTLVADIKLAFK